MEPNPQMLLALKESNSRIFTVSKKFKLCQASITITEAKQLLLNQT
jgi:hypothetical protein